MTEGVTFRIPVGDDSEAYWTLPGQLADLYHRVPPPAQAEMRAVVATVAGGFFNHLAALVAVADEAGVRSLVEQLSTLTQAALHRLEQRLEP